ncbi:DNA translocase FtsK [Ruficoccus amylovorans]|uniref:DNA translocase FtsK n=1 Tax=Ruficoccus amylovorans TaxID=1804625 RepID=A0A842HD15_9BACT|nr:DNA translocase FtsK [Ruficoccus amylovorans]MBC2594130.1 DNA translocase FtsK [Ruficoccus amylovorans]
MFRSITGALTQSKLTDRLKQWVNSFAREEEDGPLESAPEAPEKAPVQPAAAVAEPAPVEEPDQYREREQAWEREWARVEAWSEELAERQALREQRKNAQAQMMGDCLYNIEMILQAPRASEEDPEPEPEAEAMPADSAPAVEPVIGYESGELDGYSLPGTAFLRADGDYPDADMSAAELDDLHQRLQQTFDNFAVDALVCDSTVGPRVTQFRVKPGYGVRVESIAGLDNNIALALKASAVRIQAPIPGEPYVGVEVPNTRSRTITLGEALKSEVWQNSTAAIPVALGMDIAGQFQFCDLAKAPHLLIAGSTGSGKSVCINNIILSLLYRFQPGELELVLVDPKRVELAMYRELPHLIHPVVDDAKQACQALKWLVREMETRYEIMAERRVRNIAGFNTKARQEGFSPMPYIVLIIDEMADLMMTAKDDVETPIARLAQMSRAVGIHLILATQRPSVNIITGVIKANFPTRVAFKVSSQIDSRTILDGKGAETLQGKGDMLYTPPGQSRLRRLQSPFVDDDEILRVTDFIREQAPPRYRVELDPEDVPGGGEGSGEEFADGADPMLMDALAVVASTGKASTSFLQRKLKIGYNRAANLVEEMEVRGHIGPQVGSSPREVFVTPNDLPR